MSSKNLQTLCFLMCFNCVRFRGAISIPSAIRYADLCAYRAKIHIETQYLIASKNLEKLNEEDLKKSLNNCVAVHDDLLNVIYYC